MPQLLQARWQKQKQPLFVSAVQQNFQGFDGMAGCKSRQRAFVLVPALSAPIPAFPQRGKEQTLI